MRAKTRSLPTRKPLVLVCASLLSGCAASSLPSLVTDGVTQGETPAEKQKKIEDAAMAARIRFYYADFTDLSGDAGDSGCAGDATRYFQAPAPAWSRFGPHWADPSITMKPSFIRNVSLDLTNASRPTILDTDGSPVANLRKDCTIQAGSSSPEPGNCARFDRPYVATDAGKGYDTGYYLMIHDECEGAGPIAGPDPELSKRLAGGAYIDLDRGALGSDENLLLNLTFIPLGSGNHKPGKTQPPTENFLSSERPVFRVHLMKTGQAEELLKQILQPRHFQYSDTQAYPHVVQTLSVLSPPSGGPRQEQILVPLAANPDADRIRIERYTGSAILIEASLYRLGTR